MRLWGLWLFFHIENMHIIIHYDHTCTLKFLYRWLFMAHNAASGLRFCKVYKL